MAYSLDLRQRAMRALESGQSPAAVARQFSVSRPTICHWREKAANGDLSAGKPGPCGPRKFTPADDAVIRKAVAAKPGITARELVGMLNGSVSVSSMCDRLNKLDLPLKKRR